MHRKGKEGEHVCDMLDKLGRSRYCQLSLTLGNNAPLSHEMKKKRRKTIGLGKVDGFGAKRKEACAGY